MFVRTFVSLWRLPGFREVAMKAERDGQIPPADLEYILREAQADAQKLAQMKSALAARDYPMYVKLGRQFFDLPEETVQ